MITRSFAKKIYDEPCVDEAIQAYVDLATLRKEVKDDTVLVHFSDVDSDFTEEELGKEFANHVLSLTIVSYVENTF